ncbi:MAG: sensor histidine kinase [Acidimicrobiales bacterium]
MAVFVAADLVALVILAVAVALVVRNRATAEAVANARDLTVAEGRAAVWPLLTPGVTGGDPAALAALDEVVRSRILSPLLVRVKVWAADGTIVYSDEARLIGRHFPLGAAEETALQTGRADAEVSDLSEPENVYERPYGKLLEVYDGLRTASGQPVLFEAYLTLSSVNADSHRALVSLLPAMLSGLTLLFLIQVPLVWTMGRRIEAAQAEEQRLLHRALSSAEAERRLIAADLHDGAVQALAGTAMSLSAAAESAQKGGMPALAAMVGSSAAELRQGIRELRTLIVAIAPPHLHEEGLAAALRDLVSPLAGRGIDVQLELEGTLNLAPDVESLAYRMAQEAIRNVVRHAGGAHLVIVRVSRSRGGVHVEVRDDGPGFDPTALEHVRAEGHVGLRLLADLAEDSGGTLIVRSTPGAGVSVVLEVPAP